MSKEPRVAVSSGVILEISNEYLPALLYLRVSPLRPGPLSHDFICFLTCTASKMPFPDLLYYNMMTPAWLSDPKNKADWRRANTKTFEDLRVIIGPDTLPYERICTIPLLPGSFFAKAAENRNIAVKIMVGMELPNTTMEVVDGKTTALDMPTKAADPLAILLTDGNKGIGVVLQDVTQDHEIAGPYYQIQGD